MSGHQKRWVRNSNKNSEVITTVLKPQKKKPEINKKPKVILDFNSIYSLYLNALKELEYKDYLQTDHWLHFKKQAIENANAKCQLCGTKNTILNVHHKNYINKGRETFSDVIVLCKDCHSAYHEIKKNRHLDDSLSK